MTVTIGQIIRVSGYQNNPVEMCRVAGTMTPTLVSNITFEVRKPTTT